MTNKTVKDAGLPPASSLVLKVENLAAARGLRVLFEGLTFELGKGEALELRGPNGSGKSTLLRILAGLTHPHAGTVRFADGEDVLRHYLGHSDAVKPTETAGEQARFWARYFGRKDPAAREALERVGLAKRMDVPGRGLSAGQKRRLALTRLLLDPRPIWLLDEPTAALDLEGRKLVGALVDEHRRSGGVVIAAIHGDGFAGARSLDLPQLARSSAQPASGAFA
jgi:heme exporter protein A